MRTLLSAALVSLLGVVGVGCSSGDGEVALPSSVAPPTTQSVPAAPTSTAPVATAPATTAPATTAPATTAPSTSAPVDQPETTTAPTLPERDPAADPDWLAIVQHLSEVVHSLSAQPDPSRIDELCATGENPCQQRLGGQYRKMAEDGWRVDGMPLPVVESVDYLGEIENLAGEQRIVLLRVITAEPDVSDAHMLGPDGEVLFTIAILDDDDAEPSGATWTVISLPTGDWRLLGIDTGGAGS